MFIFVVFFLFDIDVWRTTHDEIVTIIHEKKINIH
jgi:hypothetical protein